MMGASVLNGGCDDDGSDERWRTVVEVVGQAEPDVLPIVIEAALLAASRGATA